jgi:hypothetical protein
MRNGLSDRRLSARIAACAVVAACTLLAAPAGASAGVIYTDINPDRSPQYSNGDPFGASAGRVNGLASTPGSSQVFYAASEWGGLYKTSDRGVTWSRLSNLVPSATWDVEVNPGDPDTVYAATFYDGRTEPRSGIAVSHTAGILWSQPTTAVPIPGVNTGPGYTCDQTRIDEPSAFGIAVRSDDPQWVFVGTNCGLAISNNAGDSWRFADPTPATPASDVWDVVAQPGGIVDICGVDGHHRTTDGGNHWTGGSPTLPRGRCSIAVSPDEPDVLFVADDQPGPSQHNVYESDNAGQTWASLGKPYFAGQNKRLPFLTANQRSDEGGKNRFDLWYGEQDLWRVECVTPPAGSRVVRRCPDAPPGAPAGSTPGGNGWFLGGAAFPGPIAEQIIGAHGDAGDLVFDPTVSTDACPMLFSSDGGVFHNTDLGSDCQNPDFTQPFAGPHGLWLWAMSGVNRPDGSAELYFGTQDDGVWASTNAEQVTPTWKDGPPSDSFTMVADENRVVWNGGGPGINVDGPGLVPGTTAPTPKGFPLVAFRTIGSIDRFGDKRYVAVIAAADANGDGDNTDPGEEGGVWVTSNITASSVNWTELGAATRPASPCGVRASVLNLPLPAGPVPVFYVQSGNCNGFLFDNTGDRLFRYVGTGSGGSWTQIDPAGGVGIFGVDPKNASRLLASNLRPAGGPQMVASTDLGNNWQPVPKLDAMMTGTDAFGDDAFRYRNERGPSNDTGFGSVQNFPFFVNRGDAPGFFSGYPQPSLAAFDPDDPSIVVAGGRDSGLFLSTNGGADWGLLTDPYGTNRPTPHLPRPWFVHFQHGAPGTFWLYVGTQGRGVWRLRVRPPLARAGGPYTTSEGTDVVLNAGESTDPDGQVLTYEWDLNGDGQFDDATGPTPVFDEVGRDRVFTVRVKVSSHGAFSIAQTTVTVQNLPPEIVQLTSTAPQLEGSPIRLAGTIADRGWRDPLTATIDWGDGTPVEPAGGDYEGERPDATLSFDRTHVYGDNGSFNATVCGRDDDTSTCVSVPLSVGNAVPTATIDRTGSVSLGGVPTFVVRQGTPLTFIGSSVDPGSDDLRLTWDWADGPPAPDVSTLFLVNPPLPDPFPSPTVQPRNVADRQQHAFARPCLYRVAFGSRDDDGGTASANVPVVVTGTTPTARGSGYWRQQYGQTAKSNFDRPTLDCYLAIVGHASLVFDEQRDASTIAAAVAVLAGSGGSSVADQLDRELLAVWLNFANGAFELTEAVDSNGDGNADTTFAAAVAAAEAVRLDASATKAQLEAQKDILERINRRDA